jgi:hypothetical protein
MRTHALALALTCGMTAAGTAPGAAAEPALVSFVYSEVRLTSLVKVLRIRYGADVRLIDPEDRLAERRISYIHLRDKNPGQALEIICRAAGVYLNRTTEGRYEITAKP